MKFYLFILNGKLLSNKGLRKNFIKFVVFCTTLEYFGT